MTLSQLMSLVSVANQSEGGRKPAPRGTATDLALFASMKVV